MARGRTQRVMARRVITALDDDETVPAVLPESIGLLAFRDGGSERFKSAIEQALRTRFGRLDDRQGAARLPS